MHRVSAPGDADPLWLVPVPGDAEPVGPCGDRNSWYRYRRVITRVDSRRTGVAGDGTGRCRPGRSLQALIVRESAPSRLSPVPGGPEEPPCVSRHRSRSPGQRAGACRYRGQQPLSVSAPPAAGSWHRAGAPEDERLRGSLCPAARLAPAPQPGIRGPGLDAHRPAAACWGQSRRFQALLGAVPSRAPGAPGALGCGSAAARRRNIIK